MSMTWNEIRKKLSIGTIWLWIELGIIIITMIALMIGKVFLSSDIWIPIVSIGIVFIITIAATILDINYKSNIKVGIIGIWTFFGITSIVFSVLMLGDVFNPEEFWIPMIPLGVLLFLGIIPTILEYTSGNVKFCPKCGKRIEKKWEFCQECGSIVIIICPSCGIKVKGNPKFCHKCGINLTEIEFVHTSRAPSKYKKEDQTNFCHNCAAPVEVGAKFCVFCGAAQ
ncbi:MAG: zinc-ribbon domain-containing protein [Candidatus Hermodarchaeota archaeon]